MTELLTLDEVAGRLRVSRRTVERLIDRRELRPIRIGRRVLVTVAECEVYLSAAFRRR